MSDSKDLIGEAIQISSIVCGACGTCKFLNEMRKKRKIEVNDCDNPKRIYACQNCAECRNQRFIHCLNPLSNWPPVKVSKRRRDPKEREKKRRRKSFLQGEAKKHSSGSLPASFQFESEFDVDVLELVNPSHEFFSEKWIPLDKEICCYVPPVLSEKQPTFAHNPRSICDICGHWGHFKKDCFLSLKK